VSEVFMAPPPPLQIILADACVLYPRVLRDYLLYAAEEGIITVTWSTEILDEMTRHLVANIPGFTDESARRLVQGMTETFPDSTIDPSPGDYVPFVGLTLRDNNDRHVMAAALAAEATIICTDNISHFPQDLLASLGITVLTADDLLSRLIRESGPRMVAAHRAAVALFARATDESTIAALRRAGAEKTADLMTSALGLPVPDWVVSAVEETFSPS
jgi:predicted nucleic acid-binding protein